jgi:hypothetical protein
MGEPEVVRRRAHDLRFRLRQRGCGRDDRHDVEPDDPADGGVLDGLQRRDVGPRARRHDGRRMGEPQVVSRSFTRSSIPARCRSATSRRRTTHRTARRLLGVVYGSQGQRLLGHVVIDTGANVVGSISNTAFIANAGTNLNTSALALDATVTNRLPAGSTPANGESNAITTSRLGSYMFVFNGATWDRFTGAITGTVSANQAGTWTVQPGNTANSTPWLTTDSADGNTGAAVPTKAEFIGVRDSTANMSGVIQCDKFALAAIASAANTQLVAISGSTVIYVCSYVIEIQGIVTTAGTNKLNYGTGTACATGTVQVTPDYIGNVTAGVPTVITQNAALGYLFKTTAGQALCSTTTTTTVQKVFVTYAQF